MWNSVALVFLTIFLYIWLKRNLDKRFVTQKFNYENTQREYDRLSSENLKLKENNDLLRKTAEETVALYDITKQICKSLDEDRVFENFRDQINSYIKIDDCKFIKNEADLAQYPDYTILPLNIDQHTIGYLAASRINAADQEKFYILSQQFLLGIERALLYQKVQELAITDSLTGVFSRRYLLERFNEEIERSRKFKYKFSFLMVDIDHFKDCNDRYGHLVGDAVLRAVSQSIKENIRQIDLVGRYGGEEFCVILAETDKEGGRFAAQRLRQSVAEKEIKVYDERLQVTISIGISVFGEDAFAAQPLIDKADRALYQAKAGGRNRVCVCGK